MKETPNSLLNEHSCDYRYHISDNVLCTEIYFNNSHTLLCGIKIFLYFPFFKYILIVQIKSTWIYYVECESNDLIKNSRYKS